MRLPPRAAVRTNWGKPNKYQLVKSLAGLGAV
jgi:hypothetical protein